MEVSPGSDLVCHSVGSLYYCPAGPELKDSPFPVGPSQSVIANSQLSTGTGMGLDSGEVVLARHRHGISGAQSLGLEVLPKAMIMSQVISMPL
jgi:hypothetical protein